MTSIITTGQKYNLVPSWGSKKRKRNHKYRNWKWRDNTIFICKYYSSLYKMLKRRSRQAMQISRVWQGCRIQNVFEKGNSIPMAVNTVGICHGKLLAFCSGHRQAVVRITFLHRWLETWTNEEHVSPWTTGHLGTWALRKRQPGRWAVPWPGCSQTVGRAGRTQAESDNLAEWGTHAAGGQAPQNH